MTGEACLAPTVVHPSQPLFFICVHLRSSADHTSHFLRLLLFVAGFSAMIFSQAAFVKDDASTSFGMR